MLSIRGLNSSSISTRLVASLGSTKVPRRDLISGVLCAGRFVLLDRGKAWRRTLAQDLRTVAGSVIAFAETVNQGCIKPSKPRWVFTLSLPSQLLPSFNLNFFPLRRFEASKNQTQQVKIAWLPFERSQIAVSAQLLQVPLVWKLVGMANLSGCSLAYLHTTAL